VTVLSWAEDPKTQVPWPVEWTVAYGKGRVYCTSFGHVWKDEPAPVDMRCADFQTIMIRATQWLAQRPVTYPIPPDFPTATGVSLRPMPTLP
jgi:type 1 glutamine amidotransferase